MDIAGEQAEENVERDAITRKKERRRCSIS